MTIDPERWETLTREYINALSPSLGSARGRIVARPSGGLTVYDVWDMAPARLVRGARPRLVAAGLVDQDAAMGSAADIKDPAIRVRL